MIYIFRKKGKLFKYLYIELVNFINKLYQTKLYEKQEKEKLMLTIHNFLLYNMSQHFSG